MTRWRHLHLSLHDYVVPLLVLILVGIALVAPVEANAHNRVNWYWSPASAEQALLDDGVEWAEGYEYVENARCRGWGKFIRARRTGRKLFKHFRCYIETTIEATGEFDAYVMNLHVLGKNAWEPRA